MIACMAPAVLRTILDTPEGQRAAVTTRPRFTVAGAPPPSAFDPDALARYEEIAAEHAKVLARDAAQPVGLYSN